VEIRSAAPVYVYWPHQNKGYLIFDGLMFRSSSIPYGRALVIVDSIGVVIRNCEFTQYSQGVFMGDHTRNFLYEQNVSHDNDTHSVYLGYTTLAGGPDKDFDFNQDAVNYATVARICVDADHLTPIACNGASDGVTLRNNVFYNDGGSGYEPVHMNAYARNVHIIGNIVHNNGGVGIGFQTGIYDSDIQNNIIFNNGRCGIGINLYGAGPLPANMRRINIFNNTIVTGDPSASIKGTSPACGIL